MTRAQGRFRAWVKQFGVSRLQRVLGKCSRTSIQAWIQEKRSGRHQPRPVDAMTMIGLSMKEPLNSDGKPLTYEDIYGVPAIPAHQDEAVAAAAGSTEQVEGG